MVLKGTHGHSRYFACSRVLRVQSTQRHSGYHSASAAVQPTSRTISLTFDSPISFFRTSAASRNKTTQHATHIDATNAQPTGTPQCGGSHAADGLADPLGCATAWLHARMHAVARMHACGCSLPCTHIAAQCASPTGCCLLVACCTLCVACSTWSLTCYHPAYIMMYIAGCTYGRHE